MKLSKPYEQMNEAERQEQARLDVYGMTVAGIIACATSIDAHLKDVTAEDRVVLEKIYHDLHVVQSRVVHGYDLEAEEARDEARMKAHFAKEKAP